MNFVENRLKALPKSHPPLFINIGKNRHTPIEKASEDYIRGLKALSPYADAFVINISSPNTKNLRQIFKKKYFTRFLKDLKNFSETLTPSKPLILKMSPDFQDAEFLSLIDLSLEAGIEAWAVSNTTETRMIPFLFPPEGGVSGKLLSLKSLHLLKLLSRHLDRQKPDLKSPLILSSGGVLSPSDVLKRLETGAHLVQVYSALIFEGPLFFQKVGRFVKTMKI